MSLRRFGNQPYVQHSKAVLLTSPMVWIQSEEAPEARWANAAIDSGACPWATQGSLEGSSMARPPAPPLWALVDTE